MRPSRLRLLDPEQVGRRCSLIVMRRLPDEEALLVLEVVVGLVGEPGDDGGRHQAEEDQRGRDLFA